LRRRKLQRNRNQKLFHLSEQAYCEFEQYFNSLNRDIQEYDKEKKHLFSVQQRGTVGKAGWNIIFSWKCEK
jgi:hypothetical protein